jgi:hypothetical protein
LSGETFACEICYLQPHVCVGLGPGQGGACVPGPHGGPRHLQQDGALQHAGPRRQGVRQGGGGDAGPSLQEF